MTQLRVTVDIFSGRPNPSVLLDDKAAGAVLERLRPAEPLGADEPSGPPLVLGYRGLLFEQLGEQEPSLPGAFRLVRGRLYGEGLRHWATDRELERALLADGGAVAIALADASLLATIAAELEREHPSCRYAGTEDGPEAPKLQNCDSASPTAELPWWNDADPNADLCRGGASPWRCQCNNNCYNYGTNIRTDTFAQPGYGGGRPLRSLDCASLRQAAFYDFLLDTPYAENTCVPGRALVAGVIAPRSDFHWYRKNQDGYWTHKPGKLQATKYDDSGQPITDPRTCNRGMYTQFCSFMVVTAGHPRISGWGPPPTSSELRLS
ncbi:MAG TPA: hypothetical protein VIH71_10040 [Solirubrobacteraceae bacterium]